MAVPLIVLVVFIVIWVLTNVLRAQQEDSKNFKRNTPAKWKQDNNPTAAAPKVEQTSDNDIARFLAEIERLRKKPASETSAAPVEKPRVKETLAGATLSQQTSQQQKPKQKNKKPRRPSQGTSITSSGGSSPPQAPANPSPMNFTSPIPEMGEARASTAPITTFQETTTTGNNPLSASPILGSRAITGAAAPTGRENAQAITKVYQLLDNPQALAQAFILQEILSQPKCRNRIIEMPPPEKPAE